MTPGHVEVLREAMWKTGMVSFPYIVARVDYIAVWISTTLRVRFYGRTEAEHTLEEWAALAQAAVELER